MVTSRNGPNGLLHVALQVPAMETACDFYSAFGLEITEDAARVDLRCKGRDQDQIQLVEGPSKRFQHVAFNIEPGSLAEYQAGLERSGVRLVPPPQAASEAGLWFLDPDGRYVNVQEGVLAPPRQSERPALNMAGNFERVDQARWQGLLGKEVEPIRLGHSLVFTPDLARAERFYVDIVGLRLSDRIKGLASFLNTGDGDHHVFGLLQSSHPGFHHASFEVDGFDEIGLGAARMAGQGYIDGFGLGRHNIGSNLFYYIRDPWGSWVEYFSDIDQITCNWEPTDWDIQDVPPASWSPALHPEFLQNSE